MKSLREKIKEILSLHDDRINLTGIPDALLSLFSEDRKSHHETVMAALPEKTSIPVEGLTDYGREIAASQGWNAARSAVLSAIDGLSGEKG